MFSIANQDSADVLDYCERNDIAFFAFFPLAMGELAGPDSAVASVAAEHDATPSQIALAWLLHRSPALLTIPGTGSLEHLEENMAARDIELTEADMDAIGRAVGA
jgi:aryl-alcohol dehydrogenase-like predicted oxidoreductase